MSEVVVRGQKTIQSLRTLQGALHQAAIQAVRDSVLATAAAARATTLWRDRRPNDGTRSTIKGEALGLRGRVEAGGASAYLEWGTRPHAIVAHGAALHFFVNGVEFFRKRVWHPGTAPRPFMRQARERGAIVAAYAAEFYANYAITHI